MVPFSEICFGSSPGEVRVRFGVWDAFWGLLEVSSAPLSNKTLDSAKHMKNTRKKVFEFRMAPCGETRSRTRRRRGRDRSHNSLWVSMFHFAVCLSSLNSCCGFCLSFSFSLCFPFLRYPGLQASPAMFG